MKKLGLLFFAFFLVSTSSFSQKSLKMTRTMTQYWSEFNKEWTGWPETYDYYEEGNEPIIKFTKLDVDGKEFLVEIWTPDHASFKVSYTGFREDQNAHVYEDSSGDEVWILGSTISYLSMNGWPDNVVSIYFWIYSEDYALLME